ncbi:MAG: methyltransferase domain-containing protein [Ilumatobacteraceae bacterium]
MRWDPVQYGRFAAERGRPFDDLLARVQPSVEPSFVVDLGCGPGNLTATLAKRWPRAEVLGVDSSPEMIATATAMADDRLHFVEGDLAIWHASRPADVVVSNAALQWVPQHINVLPHLAGMVAANGWLAFQVPGNYADPSHTLIDDLRRSPKWRDVVGDEHASLSRWQNVPDTADYVEALWACNGVDLVDVWESTYFHVLAGDDPVWQWMRGTGFRPVLSAVPEERRDEFDHDYRDLLRQAYPARSYGTVLSFRRLFAVAHLTR